METVSIVVPCYNEEENIDNFYNEIKKVVEKIKHRYLYELIFINDGSKDNTEKIIKKLRNQELFYTFLYFFIIFPLFYIIYTYF